MVLNEEQWIKELREKRIAYGISQGRLAVASGITREYLNKIESGKMKPSKELLETLHKELARFNPEAPLTMLFDYVKIRFPTLDIQYIIKDILKLNINYMLHEDYGHYSYTEETTSYWFDLPIDIAEFEEKLGVGAESGDYRIIEKVLPYADEVHEQTSVYQLNELDFMYRQLSSDMQEEYTALLTVYENLEALYICRNVITVYPDCKSMIDVARQKLMNDPTFKHLSEDCQEYYFDFEAYASHLQEHGKFLVTEHGIFELPE